MPIRCVTLPVREALKEEGMKNCRDLPPLIRMSDAVLVLSDKQDCYFTTSLIECSCIQFALGERPCPHQIKISQHYNLGKAISRSNIEIAIHLLRDSLEERSKKEYDELGEQRKKLLKPEEEIYSEERKEEERLRREQEERRKKEKETIERWNRERLVDEKRWKKEKEEHRKKELEERLKREARENPEAFRHRDPAIRGVFYSSAKEKMGSKIVLNAFKNMEDMDEDQKRVYLFQRARLGIS